MIQSYLRDRVLYYNTIEGRITNNVRAGISQESMLGPDIWNIDYDEILRLKDLSKGVFLIG